jgi:predicted Zn-dependent protease
MRGLAILGCVIACAACLAAQTKITPPRNGAPLKQDVELGRKAAEDVERSLPLLGDDAVTNYVRGVGGRLAAGIPSELQHPEFAYTFTVVDVKDINAFALPGGPMFVHRGIVEAAHNEGELAGVMAHEMSHVALRHGTAQMSKARKFGLGQLAGIIIGGAVGGTAGEVIYQGSQFGMNAAFLRYSRDDEKDADLLGAQIMARANYDPRDLARMFETIEKEGGQRSPQWLSDHPNPGNRVQYINQEATYLIIDNPVGDSAEFTDIQDHLKTLPPAPTLAEIAKRKKK